MNNIIDKRTKGEWKFTEVCSLPYITNDTGENIAQLSRKRVVRSLINPSIDNTIQVDTELRANAAFIVKACNEYEGLHKEIEWHKGIEEKLLNENEELLEALKDARGTLILANLIDKSNTCEKTLKVVEEAIKKHSPIN